MYKEQKQRDEQKRQQLEKLKNQPGQLTEGDFNAKDADEPQQEQRRQEYAEEHKDQGAYTARSNDDD